MRLRTVVAYASLPLLSAGIYAAGCNASGKASKLNQTPGTGGEGNVGTGGGNHTGGAGGVIFTTSSSDGGSGGMIINPCGTGCGPQELCDTDHLGTDDDCNGLIDDTCQCQAGLTHWCFKGDPSFLGQPGCFPGTESCSEFGAWGECIGGVGADVCGDPGNQTGCHAITTPPFVTANLKDGTGNFSNGALTESWDVACPPGVTPCPAVVGSNPADDFQPIVSGEYTVTYHKTDANGPSSCTYPLFVGAPGLRIELDWEHDPGGSGPDLDLHVHKPADSSPWGANSGNDVDCTWDNCTATDFEFGFGPEWFFGVAPPAPVAWYLDPVLQKNTCYFAPRGVGAQWQSIGQGCHNPRLDLDNITCTPSVVDPNSSSFCAPENVNIDFPPNDQFTRIGVHYYYNHGLSNDVHPRVRIFCNGQMAAELGPAGYNAPVTFTPADGDIGGVNDVRRFWMVADVRFKESQCAAQSCEVVPLFQNPATHTPYLSTVQAAQASVGPPYPP